MDVCKLMETTSDQIEKHQKKFKEHYSLCLYASQFEI